MPPGSNSPSDELVNDVHSALNPTWVQVRQPSDQSELCERVAAAASKGSEVAICGGRHAMGGQQFASNCELLDLRRMNRILELDMERGLVRAQAGIQWPELIHGLIETQHRLEPGQPPRWAIAQKQTGADALSLGGALAANIHGRGLLMGPVVENVEAFTLIDPTGSAMQCSRTENSHLFALAIGGYGLFGPIADVTLRLVPRRTLRRIVRVIDIEDAIPAAERRIAEGFVYGDFQFDIDSQSPEFLTKGVFSGYFPLEDNPQPPDHQQTLSRGDWLNLLTLAHSDKSRAFKLYAQHYLATDGQLYSSDVHQLSEYLDNYHEEVDRRMSAKARGSEIISELYVPPEKLVEFLRSAARLLVQREAQVIYGTIRLIQPDRETVMAWARERFACVICNLHVDHTSACLELTADTFRGLIDLASDLGGSYYLTYHRYATPMQMERCYPRVREFFAAKRTFDPAGTFQSDWHRHYAPQFAN